MVPKKLAVIAEEMSIGSAAQQLLDRWLAGFPFGGTIHARAFDEVILHAPAGAWDGEVARRVTDFGLRTVPSATAAVEGSVAAAVIPAGSGVQPSGSLHEVLRCPSTEGRRCFVHGVLAEDGAIARSAVNLARSRNVTLFCGGALPFTWRLPPADVPHGADVREVLIVAVGDADGAYLAATDALLALAARRKGGEAGIRRIRALEGKAVWKAGDEGEWSKKLLAAALSRSDTPQGNGAAESRPEELVESGLVSSLAREPAACLFEHADGFRSSVLLLNGVVADFNFACEVVKDGEKRFVSSQLYRPCAPATHELSALAAAVNAFFGGGPPPWPPERSILHAGLLDVVRRARTRPGDRIETGDLQVAFSVPEPSTFPAV
ncbi:MAG TPA: hypothetical protein VFD71_00530 [Planctomycetota bacterium]|nr:hypothetical protein [Planctomycetota bacterium]